MTELPKARDLRRILIIGSAGSGKSTLARHLGAALDLPVYHMDREVFWLPGWVERDRADQLVQVERIIAKDAWVFEGNNSRTFPQREARAHLLIWLEVPLGRRLIRVIRRSLRGRGKVRVDMADGCPERIASLPGFLRFILRTRADSHAKQRRFYEQTQLPKARIRTIGEADALVARLAS